ncbi:MAG TPA: ATP-binding cassette domain-containing protein [Vicinamibacterales bacterium]|jgi:ABC-2 type transport system ATP-binding protein|nr:ATP-binding cassette domain-containing protein [Vicinamibacterales bacterium]
MTGHLAVETERLRRVYTTRGATGRASKLVVLDDVTLSVRRGELFGLLGVNGAGKSTLLQILAAQLRPTSGTAKVAGFDVCRYGSHVRRHVGVVCAADGPVVRLRAPELSSGQRQRLSLERGFAGRPRVLLLDQPTLGLDCAASREMRGFIRRWVHEDDTRTVVMATNDMAEASELCDRVAVLDGGRLLTCETPAALSDRWRPEPPRPDTRAHGAAALEAAFLALVGRRPLLAGA